jgi:hypothetical protein
MKPIQVFGVHYSMDVIKVHDQNVELGDSIEYVIEFRICKLTDAGNYLFLFKIYVRSGKWRETSKVSKTMNRRGFFKIITSSCQLSKNQRNNTCIASRRCMNLIL